MVEKSKMIEEEEEREVIYECTASVDLHNDEEISQFCKLLMEFVEKVQEQEKVKKEV